MERRRFVAFAGASLCSVAAGHGQSSVDPLPALARDTNDGELVYVGRTRDPVRIKVSPPPGGRFAMITQDVAPGSVIPVHLHEKEDEIIFIQSGEGTATLGDQQVTLAAGSTLYVPQGTWHGGENTGTSILKWVAIYSPSGFEGYFRAIGTKAPGDPPTPRSREEFEKLDRRFGIRYRR
jgi:mannose-6-phosphate isomerase-like protein (cupin superfamily)